MRLLWGACCLILCCWPHALLSAPLLSLPGLTSGQGAPPQAQLHSRTPPHPLCSQLHLLHAGFTLCTKFLFFGGPVCPLPPYPDAFLGSRMPGAQHHCPPTLPTRCLAHVMHFQRVKAATTISGVVSLVIETLAIRCSWALAGKNNACCPHSAAVSCNGCNFLLQPLHLFPACL